METLVSPVFMCRNVRVWVADREVVRGVDLDVAPGQIHAIMGPNGSGKSSLANALMGHPAYTLEGTLTLSGEDVTSLAPEEKARLGMFLGFQYPIAVPGVTVASFLRAAVGAVRGKEVPVREFRTELMARMAELDMAKTFAGRYLNDGFSGGEKKRAEILQMATLKPEIAILDETDSGLDIDALRIVAEGVNALSGPDLALHLEEQGYDWVREKYEETSVQ